MCVCLLTCRTLWGHKLVYMVALWGQNAKKDLIVFQPEESYFPLKCHKIHLIFSYSSAEFDFWLLSLTRLYNLREQYKSKCQKKISLTYSHGFFQVSGIWRDTWSEKPPYFENNSPLLISWAHVQGSLSAVKVGKTSTVPTSNMLFYSIFGVTESKTCGFRFDISSKLLGFSSTSM